MVGLLSLSSTTALLMQIYLHVFRIRQISLSLSLSLSLSIYIYNIYTQAQNLITATTAVKKNYGLNAVGFSSLGVMLGWSLWWAASFTSAMFVTSGCNAAGVCEREANGLVVFLFLVSFYWSHQVIKNTVHCTVAGTVGTWWFAPHEASSCCSSAIRDSWIRSVTTSFGSICFGSLIGKFWVPHAPFTSYYITSFDFCVVS